MSLLIQALRAGRGDASEPGTRPVDAVVVGGGGPLGSAVLEQLLARRGFGQVRVLVTQGFHVAMNGLGTVIVDAGLAEPPPAALAEVGLIVFDRPRHANGREQAFHRPAPAALPALAGWLHAAGVRQLLIVTPHHVASLPHALKAGLANLDEQAVAALGFEHVVFVRSAAAPADARSKRWLQRVADGVLAQLRLMVPAQQQPVRVRKVAQFVAELAAQLPRSMPGTRVAPPELVWHAAQLADPLPLVQAWLEARALPPVAARRMKL